MSYTVTGAGRTSCMTGGVLTLTSLARAVSGTQKLQASPASILAYYIINEMAEMTDPSDKDDWPIYK